MSESHNETHHPERLLAYLSWESFVYSNVPEEDSWEVGGAKILGHHSRYIQRDSRSYRIAQI